MDYISVVDAPEALARMLALSDGQRRIPVIVEGERITIGYLGKG